MPTRPTRPCPSGTLRSRDLSCGDQRAEDPGPRPASILSVPEIAVVLGASGEAYVTLVVGSAPEVRDSVALDALEAADTIPALDNLVLDFDHYGRVVGLRITGAADSILAPSLLQAAQRGERKEPRRS
jgi:uncharacterized protein YuzE